MTRPLGFFENALIVIVKAFLDQISQLMNKIARYPKKEFSFLTFKDVLSLDSFRMKRYLESVWNFPVTTREHGIVSVKDQGSKAHPHLGTKPAFTKFILQSSKLRIAVQSNPADDIRS